ncbi:MAG TPA: C45 family peptidase [Moheibacter sp.]|nr:C45 family peptidase [Moheibacter sp.]
MQLSIKNIIIPVFTILLSSCVNYKHLPDFGNDEINQVQRKKIDESYYIAGPDKLIQNSRGIWEMYLEGKPLERGIANGVLTKELIYKQESIFVARIKELVPKKSQQELVANFLRFFNRELEEHVISEYQEEIFGISKSTSHEFDFVAPVYWRTLFFHAAHDIGHALQDLAMVGCTSFAAWNAHTSDGKMIIGRNFDFYINDAFAENKIVAFINPENGYKHAIVTWPGFIGAVSGMNEKGLTVTINAGKSSIPLKAKTPISLLTREILQYASNIEEAVEIAKKREVFVSESIMIGSAEDKNAVLIEVSPHNFGIFQVENNSGLLVCSNHFQSENYLQDKKNQKAIAESHSQYRFDRMNELFSENPPITVETAAEFLRNKNGLNNLKIGYGNEKAINQLLSHHAVIFKPEERLMWVSANPYQLGAFVAYDLDEVFDKFQSGEFKNSVAIDSLTIPEDDFLYSKEFREYKNFKDLLYSIQLKIDNKEFISENDLERLINLNMEYWLSYFTVAEYYFGQNSFAKALKYYKIALTKEITTLPDQELIEKRIQKTKRKLK